MRSIIIEAAVKVLDFVTDKRIICLKQRIDNRNIFFSGDTQNKPFVYSAYIPMAWNGIFAALTLSKSPSVMPEYKN